MKLDMFGPFDFTVESIDNNITYSKPGDYALGFQNSSGLFVICYIGRAEKDLRTELKCFIGTPRYDKFKFSYSATVKEAYETQCKIYHDYGGFRTLDNHFHPMKPSGGPYHCPTCGD